MAITSESQVVLRGPHGEALVRKTPNVCGGDACIRDTRIMVWLLVSFKLGGMPDDEILEGYPGLTPTDLTAAWKYYRQHPAEIDEAIATQENDD